MADCLSLLGCPVSHAALEEPRTEEVQYHSNNSTASEREGASPTKHQQQEQEEIHDNERKKSPVSKDKRQSPVTKNKADVSHLPILIIPGFMSSGLEIIKSEQRPNWEGKRVWLNLSSLGLSAMYFGSAQREKEGNNKHEESDNKNEEEQEQQYYKSFWLNHMRLNDSTLCTDPKGIQVRAIQGLEGVDYLTPGAFTSHVSYVFGPVIDVLRAKGGYVEGVNLQAAPYDWRLPPMALEQRDQYFSRTLKQVEELYHNSHKTPVVLVGHSLGTKTAHYFLNFCLQQKGQAWIDKHIHTYLPVGAPHLGAPKALRSVVAGDKMGLDAFLSDEEALALGRGIGSGPWLFPQQLPPGVPSSVYVKPHGVLEITVTAPLDTHSLVNKRTSLSKPNRYQLIVTYGKDSGKRTSRKLLTPFMPIIRTSNSSDNVMFTDNISFATEPDAKDAIKYGGLRFFLQEPGIAAAKEEKEESSCCCNPIFCLLKWITCCCICDYTYRLVRWILCGLMKGVALSADAITGGVGGGTNLAFSAGYVDISPDVWTGKTVTRQIRLYHKDDYQKYERFLCFYVWKKPRVANLSVQMKWIPYKKEPSMPPLCSPVCQPYQEKDSPNSRSKTPNLKISHSSKKHQTYHEFAGHDILEREGLSKTLQLVRDVYDADSDIGPRTKSALDAPPVQRIHAIYGINIATEVGSVYKRKDNSLAQNYLKNLYQLDTKAHVDAKSGYLIKHGLLYETPNTRQSVAGGLAVCGDGTVPYWSLQHCKTWESEGRQVSVVELDKAEHREILADARFHEALLEYCKIQKESV